MSKKLKILVTGSEGYIGSVLVPMLQKENFEITGIDTCFYSKGNLGNYKLLNYKLIKMDIRDIKEDLFFKENYYAVVHLAALSNDPLGMIDEKLTYEINFKASVSLAKMAKNAGIRRFIFASSCSVYGKGFDKLTEESSLYPLTAYAKSKALAEQEILKLADDNFSPTILRNATAFGFSPRMRFDIVVNNLTGYAYVEKEIKILGDGTPWRPLVHVKDISSVIIKVLKSKRNIIHNEIFNVGDDNENYQIKDIAEHIRKFFFNCKISIAQKNAKDSRNYNVSFKKLNTKLNYKCKIPLDLGIKELKMFYERINLNKELFYHRYYNRLKQIEYLIENKKLNKSLRWKNAFN